MLQLHQTLWRLNFPALLAMIAVIVFTVLRVALLNRCWSEVAFNLPDLAGLFLRGLLFDTVVAAYIYGFFSLLGLLMPERLRQSVAGHRATLAVAWVYLFALGFVVVAEWFFWSEFSVR